MDAMPWEDLCRITLKKSIMASSPWLARRFTHTHIMLCTTQTQIIRLLRLLLLAAEASLQHCIYVYRSIYFFKSELMQDTCNTGSLFLPKGKYIPISLLFVRVRKGRNSHPLTYLARDYVHF